ncbi:MAG: catalase HPII, partial [Polaromonas sp.]
MPKTIKPSNSRSNASNASKTSTAAKAAARNTDSGPARIKPDASGDLQADKMAQTEALAAAMPFNPTKPTEHGFANAIAPQRGATADPESRLPIGSTLSEENGSEKTGSMAPEGVNSAIEPLDRVRVDSSGQMLTTNQGVAVSDNQ